MNFYFSSSFNEKDNTKVNFKNELPHILFDNKSIILKSLRIHNTPSLLKNEKISHFKSSISDTSRVNSNIWKREEGYHIVINPFKLTLTIKKNTNTTGENDNKLSLKTSHISYDINFPKKTYKSSLKFVKDLNNLFKENKISLKFEINHKKSSHKERSKLIFQHRSSFISSYNLSATFFSIKFDIVTCPI